MTKDNQAIRIKMANGCSSWFRAPTRKNASKIYEFLLEQSEGKKRKPEFTYSNISKATGINPHQVQFACQKMAFREKNPQIKIFTKTIGKKDKLRLIEMVVLINTLKKNSDGGSE